MKLKIPRHRGAKRSNGRGQGAYPDVKRLDMVGKKADITRFRIIHYRLHRPVSMSSRYDSDRILVPY